MKKTILQCFLIVFIFDFSFALGQDNDIEKVRFFGLEAGIDPLFCVSPEYDFIRGDVIPSAYGSVYQTLKGKMFKEYLGLKMEIRNSSNHWGLLVGLRYTWLKSFLGKESYYNATSKYFYLLENQTGTTTEYLRINEIDRDVDYLGMPIELRWLSNSQRLLKFYIKAGIEINYKIKSNSEVVFHDPAMADNKEIVLAKFGEPSSIFSAVYLSAGLNLDKKPNIDLEFILPYILLTPDMTGILTSHSGLGIKIEIRLPY